MKIIRDFGSFRLARPLAVALGNFDGVHLGHRALITQCVKDCQEHNWLAGLLTFEPHPLSVISKERSIKLINTTAQKLSMIEALGMEYAFLLKFTEDIALTSPEVFVQQILVKTLNVKKVYVGFNYSFGYQGQGSAQTLEDFGKQYGFAVSVHPPALHDGDIVSSSLIREKLTRADIEATANLLGYWPYIEGPVQAGKQRGRLMGYPTANLQLDPYLLLPPYGVYAALTVIRGHAYASIVNIGVKPTFGLHQPTAEVHIINYRADLYGQDIKIILKRYIRGEQRFEHLDALRRQIEQDVQRAKQILNLTH